MVSLSALPEFETALPVARIQTGSIVAKKYPDDYEQPSRAFIDPPESMHKLFSFFPLADLVGNPYYTMLDSELCPDSKGCLATAYLHEHLFTNHYALYDMGRILTGFAGLSALAKTDSRVLLLFDEKLASPPFSDMPYWVTVNIVEYNLKASDEPYNMLTFEPYAFRYAAVLALTGEVVLLDLHLCEYAALRCAGLTFSASDPRVVQMVAAGRENCRQHAVDLLMDNSNRERGIYIMESFFTAQGLPFYSEDFRVEKNHLENYALAGSFKGLPKGMLPMAYPSDFRVGLPNFAMWYVLEVEVTSRLLANSEFAARAANIRLQIVTQSFDGAFSSTTRSVTLQDGLNRPKTARSIASISRFISTPPRRTTGVSLSSPTWYAPGWVRPSKSRFPRSPPTGVRPTYGTKCLISDSRL
jgi:hypothetical protein